MDSYWRGIEELLPVHGTQEVAHYTKIGTLPHFLPAPEETASLPGWKSARATPVQFLNDRKELTLGLRVLDEVASQASTPTNRIRAAIDYLLKAPGDLASDAFQMSFSGAPDEIGQWRGYAANGMGCAVVTQLTALRDIADISGWIIYDKDAQRAFARNVVDLLVGVNEKDPQTISKVLIAAASFCKHEGFSPEVEFRVLLFPRQVDVQFREVGDRIVPYVDFLKVPVSSSLPITKVIIGPGWQLSDLPPGEFQRNHVVQGIKRLLDSRGLSPTDIESSKIPYDPK